MKGEDMFNSALYYPYIAFRDVDWLKAMAMYYECIYRIVPNNTNPDDSEALRPLLEDGSVGAMIDPIPYTEQTADVFLKKRRKWSASALSASEGEQQDIALLHTDKTDSRVRELFNSLGYEQTETWLQIPTELASNYMLFLASEIGKRNQLNLITNEWAPWTATTYFSLNGGVDDFLMFSDEKDSVNDPFALFCLIVGEIAPINISDIPARKVQEFRIKRRDEISNFRVAVSDLYLELQKLEDPKLRYDFQEGKTRIPEKCRHNQGQRVVRGFIHGLSCTNRSC
jgi:hypothetical protein